ncbi:MAG: ornithine carbamoyltransferase [Anaerolineales bacterium]|jgi:N-acetylornithine carbamoyltransferase|nr:ornithine carbamoyltransferase [Anaerolineales bacterium]MDP6771532.1 ornithine carbamoyltransferase [Anaerolineales bacterium]
MDMRGRDYISDLDFSKEETEHVLELAWELKNKRNSRLEHALLKNKVLAMLFFFSSTRTRGSFEAGMAQLGGHAAFIEPKTTQISHGDTEMELGQIYGRYFDGIAIRHCDWGVGNKYLRDVAAASIAPVLNMQCEVYHPHQCLADLMTMMEVFNGDIKGKRVAVSWAYASSYLKPISCPQSLILQLPRFGMDVVVAHPTGFELMPEILGEARDLANKNGTGFDVVHDMEEGCANVDVVYAKSWGPLMTTADDEEGKAMQDQHSDWIANENIMAMANDDAVYMHPLPADRDIEVAKSVLEGNQSVVFQQAENRLHAQKAVMALTMG